MKSKQSEDKFQGFRIDFNYLAEHSSLELLVLLFQDKRTKTKIILTFFIILANVKETRSIYYKNLFRAVSIYFQRAVFHLYGEYCMDSAFAVYRKRLEQLGNCKILVLSECKRCQNGITSDHSFGFHYDFWRFRGAL